MEALLKKLNFKSPARACILHLPEGLDGLLAAIPPATPVDTTPQAGQVYDFALAFCEQASDIARHFPSLAPQLAPDAVYYIAYPKKSSKRYQSDINRDADCWQVLGGAGYEGVRQVAIDEDWSALRFRHVDFIKSMQRSSARAMSQEGKKRTKR